jgi:hypothetical protein
MKPYGGRGGRVALILNLGARRRRGVSLMLRPRYRHRRSRGTHYLETGWAAEPVFMFRKREKSLAPAGFEIRIVEPVASSLYRLSRLCGLN